MGGLQAFLQVVSNDNDVVYLLSPKPNIIGYNRDPNIEALKRRGFINHGPTLAPKMTAEGVFGGKCQLGQGFGFPLGAGLNLDRC